MANAPAQHWQEALQLMQRFAERTGLCSERPQQRYLWTDAFAVCNLLGMAVTSGDEYHRELALNLVDRVHHTLGRHRADDKRHGWISGLDEREGALHPTRGGLRIGKPLPERPAGAPLDEEAEWDRDGQYFHYLTKWMHALDQTARATRQPRFNLWARELAEAAYRAFSYRGPGGELRMVWKVSIDLSRPLVLSMGHHDPLDGLVSCAQLRATAAQLPAGHQGPDLGEALEGFASMTESGRWATADSLGLGGLLTDACRLQQLQGSGLDASPGLVHTLLSAALQGLPHYAQAGDLRAPASRRLAFRELGLSLGLHAVPRMRLRSQREDHPSSETDRLLADLDRYAPLGEAIESFWVLAENQGSPTWVAHRDINEVMLASSLSPDGCLLLGEA